MKNIVLTLALFVAFAATAFALPYNVGNNDPVPATLTITGEVVAPPITIVPDNVTMTLGNVFPGEFETFTDKKQQFIVTCAKGYGIQVTGSTNLTDNDAYIEAQVGYTTVEGGEITYWIPVVEATAAIFDIYGSQTVGGYAEVWVNVSKFGANAGAHVGTRTFTFTASAEYKEQ